MKGGKKKEKVMTSVCDRAHVRTHMLQHRRIEFPREWKHQDISVLFSWNTLRFTHQIRTFKTYKRETISLSLSTLCHT